MKFLFKLVLTVVFCFSISFVYSQQNSRYIRVYITKSYEYAGRVGAKITFVDNISQCDCVIKLTKSNNQRYIAREEEYWNVVNSIHMADLIVREYTYQSSFNHVKLVRIYVEENHNRIIPMNKLCSRFFR